EATAAELGSAFRAVAQRAGGQILICFCPSWLALQADPAVGAWFGQMEEKFARDLADVNGIDGVTSRALLELYPLTLAELAAAQGDRLGHVPYTPVFFSALGTFIARKMDAWKRPRPKVIALDCDQTLWAGICGEDADIEIDPPRQALQEFMRAKL